MGLGRGYVKIYIYIYKSYFVDYFLGGLERKKL